MTPPGRDPAAMGAIETAAAFCDRINARDLDGLAALMTDDHAFIDKTGARIVGKDACCAAWRMFFEMFPDYRNEIDRIIRAKDCVLLTGCAVSSDERLAGPALWMAKARNGAVAEWRVDDDTPARRRELGIAND